MPKVAILNMAGETVGEMDLNDSVFGIKISAPSMHQVVVASQANARQGTQSAKTRSEVRGGGKKPWRQKGTGRARAGTRRAPNFVHGGVVFAPKPRSYSKSVNKKTKRLAMKSAFTSKVIDGDFIIVDDIALSAPKTGEMVKALDALGVTKKALVIVAKPDEMLKRATHNIQGITLSWSNTINVLDILKHGKLIISKEAVEIIQEVYA